MQLLRLRPGGGAGGAALELERTTRAAAPAELAESEAQRAD